MNAALEKVLAFGQVCNLAIAALKDSGPCHGKVGESAGAFGDGFFPAIQIGYEATAEARHLGKGVRLAALIHNPQHATLVQVDYVRFEVPLRIRMAGGGLREEIGQSSKRAKGNVFTEVWSQRSIKRGWIAFVQCHHLCEVGLSGGYGYRPP